MILPIYATFSKQDLKIESGLPPLPLGEGRGEGSLHRSDVVGYKRAGKYFFTKQLALLLGMLPHPAPLPEGEGVRPHLWRLKVLPDSNVLEQE